MLTMVLTVTQLATLILIIARAHSAEIPPAEDPRASGRGDGDVESCYVHLLNTFKKLYSSQNRATIIRRRQSRLISIAPQGNEGGAMGSIRTPLRSRAQHLYSSLYMCIYIYIYV